MAESRAPSGKGKFVECAWADTAVRAHYHEAGEGTDYVMFMQTGGAGTSAYMCWYLNLAPFAQAGYHVYAPDAPGFGLTEQGPGPASGITGGRVDAAEFTLAFMDAMGVESAHFVGNSMGSMTSSRIAIDHPHRVKSLILTGGEPRVDSEASRAIAPTLGRTARMDFVREMLSKPEVSAADMRKATADFFYDREHPGVAEVAAMRLEDIRRPGVQDRERAAAFRQIQGGRSNISSSDLAAIRAPACLIHGRDERFFFSKETAPVLIEDAIKACLVIPDCGCVVLPRCGHWPQIEKADTFNTLSLNFLHGLGRA